ncbi:molybdopterin oxidoreductase family protein [Sandaracinobacteroides saxicola]|uniref:molybdopterin oxidoreductase family protein n=1 Tax=Sandaracinobacteroides saxicola TaxID=2759707 RepID=UPI001A9C39D8|nr:molybdopterin oxidoreductase family protein [Sandaracinobacteroides saxicola]
MSTVHTRTCHICEANCGILVELEGAKVLSIKGDPDDVLSRGHVCPKATAIADLQDDPDRLRTPVKRMGDRWVPIEWETAYAEIAARYAAIKTAGGQGALYIGNPTAHNYSVGMQFGALKKALATDNVFSASTVDQIPHQLVQLWIYGHNSLFPVADIDRTRTMLIIGGNPLASNGSVWTVPDVKRRIEALQARGGRLIVVDPRRTETAKIADEHHFVRPGSDAALLVGLLLALDAAGAVRPGRLLPMLKDWDAVWEALRRFDLADCAAFCGISETAFHELAAALGDGPSIVYGRMGVSVAAFGTLNHWLIAMLNIATGHLDAEGGMMFSTPGVDVVAQSGRGSQGRRHSRVRGLPDVMGEFPVVTMAEEILTPGEGQVRALVTVAGNPVLSCPDGGTLDKALESLELMVSVDMYVTATTRHAHYILPPCGPLQKDHYPLFLGAIAVRNFAKYAPALLPMGADRSDWQIVSELSRALLSARGQAVPNIMHPREALDAMLRRSNWGLTLAQVEAAPHGIDLGPLQAGRLPARLATPDKLIHCAPEACMGDLDRLTEAMAAPVPEGLTLIGRRHVRQNNSWLHNSRRLLKGPDRCTLMIHPDDAAPRGIGDGAMVTVASEAGEVTVSAEVSDDVMPGVVSLPHGFGHGREGVKLSVAREKPGVSINDLTRRDRFDPLSGNAALTGTPVAVALAA